MAPRSEDKTLIGERVQNILGDPDVLSRQDRALLEVAYGIQDLQAHGCNLHCQTDRRIARLEGFRRWAVGLAAGAIATGVFLAFILGIIQAVKMLGD